jgi:ATP-binding cassette subfamily B protein
MAPDATLSPTPLTPSGGDTYRTPALPDSPLRFILHFVRRYRHWYALITVLEAFNAACGILLPYALGTILKAVTDSQGQAAATLASLKAPVLLFIGLCAGEVVFGRLAGAVQVRLGPRQRQQVVREIYHYLQHHSQRYFSNHFAGALAHRISETSLGVTQTLWSLITEFWPTTIVLGVTVGLLFQAQACSPAWAMNAPTWKATSAANCAPSASPTATPSVCAGSSSRPPRCSRSGCCASRCSCGRMAASAWAIS